MKFYALLFVAVISTSALANNHQIDPQEFAVQTSLSKELNKKESQALRLIQIVGRYNSERFSTDMEKGESEDNYYAFIARFQSLREDKQMALDFSSQKICSDRYDRLIKDLQKYLK